MSSTAHATPDTVPAIEPVLSAGPIIVATDTTVASDAALPLASALAERAGAEVIALSIIEPTNIPVYGIDGMVFPNDLVGETDADREHATRAQIRRMVSASAKWPIIVRSGTPATEIALTAGAMLARLIVVGRGRHHGFDRFLSGENVLKILQHGDTPVLAVDESLTSPPRRVVIATDFSPFSLFAATVALSVVAPDATVWLLHVGPPFDEMVPIVRDRADAYRQQAAAAFATMRAQLPTTSAHIESVVLTGSAPDELMRYVIEQKADLVVSATHGYGFIRRALLGSVAATLVRNAPCSVLIVPGSARTIAEARARRATNHTTQAVIPAAFDAELATFTVRNAGRFCVVEVDRDDIGAQLLGRDLQFVGGTFDRHTNDVSLMFGTSTLRGMHLTHSIPNPSEIDVTSDAGGEDQVLRIAHEGGQTLITMR